MSTDGLGPVLSAILRARGLLGSQVDLTYTIPQQVMVSAYQQITRKFALMANLGWQNWEQFGKINVSIASENPTSLTADANLKDTWHAAIGAQYRLATPWLLSLGFAYDSSAVGDADRIPALAVDRQLRYAMGIQYDWNRNVTWGLAYEFVDLGNAPHQYPPGTSGGSSDRGLPHQPPSVCGYEPDLEILTTISQTRAAEPHQKAEVGCAPRTIIIALKPP